MKIFKKVLILLILVLLKVVPVNAFDLDGLNVSLLTVLPRSNEVYTIYGHSALRISYPDKQIDEVYNWGTFNFRAPNFLYRFVKGETDYYLGTTDYSWFLRDYSSENASIVEQTLNLTKEEKKRLIQILVTNKLPENIIYRYNFLFDNCTTRIRDILENSTNNSIIYPEQSNSTTFRELIHSCTNPYPWMTFGIDLVIGSDADSPITTREKMFLPLEFKKALDNSSVKKDNDKKESVVNSSLLVLESSPEELPEANPGNSPMTVGILLLFFYGSTIIFGYFNKRQFKGLFCLLFLFAALAGCIIAFLVFFSYHPSVSPNWNIVWLHPLHWIGFTGYFFKKSYPLFNWYHRLNLLLLCLLLITWHWLPQTLNTANIPYILCLVLASAFWLFNSKRKYNE